ncbi:MAG TPA: S8 family serine peptidase [Candidatus Methylomirabilis sp.]|nr:S8 family serine peptidase [Candidatus Methylomirabilis sp.]
MKQGLVPVAAVALLLLGAWPGSSAAGRSDWLFPTGPGISTMGEGLGPEPKGDPRIASRVVQAARFASALSQAQADQRAYATRLMAGFARFDDQGRFEVYITVEEVTEQGALTALRNAGVEIEIYDASQRLVQGWVSSTQLQDVAGLPGVRFIDLPNYGVTNTGSVTTEGDGVIRADQLRAIGVTGSGVKVGVISDGINGLTSSITSSDLPASGVTMPAAPLTGGGISLDSPLPGATVFTLTPMGRPDLTTGSEGRAMLEIIHDVAPGAQLFFAPGFTSSLGFQRAVRWLVAQGVKVVADDVVHFNAGPYDGTSVVSQEAAAAVANGSSYFVAVGNYAQQHYQGLFTDADGDTLHEFDVSLGLPRVDNAGETLNVTLQPGETVFINLQWNDPFGASTNDYDLCAHDPADIPSSPLFCSTDPQTGTQNPTESFTFARSPGASGPGTLGVRINKVGMAAPRVFDLFILGGVMKEFVVADGSVPNKADAGGGVTSVGAVNWQTPNTIEFFSSRGPTNDGRLKPELVAPNRVATTVPGFSSFAGTSASTPHAAGVAALLLSRFPRMTPGQLRRALGDATLDLGPLGADNTYGHGLMDGSVFTRMRVLHP